MLKIVNKELLPIGINELAFKDMLDRILYFLITNFEDRQYPGIRSHSYIDETGIPSADPEVEREIENITFELSNDMPVNFYSGLKLSEVKKQLIKKIKEINDKRVPETIDRIDNCESKGELSRLAEVIANLLADEAERCNENIDFNDIFEDVSGIISQIEFTSMVLGEYKYDFNWNHHDAEVKNERIVLYINNIEVCSRKYKNSAELFESTLAHELFHFYHNYLSLTSTNYYYGEFAGRKDYLSTVVTESFASYFEYEYCKYRRIYTDLYDNWEKNSILIYPYSGAKGFNSLQELKEAFYYSLDDDGGMNNVLRAMLMHINNQFIEDIYCNIINKRNSVRNIGKNIGNLHHFMNSDEPLDNTGATSNVIYYIPVDPYPEDAKNFYELLEEFMIKKGIVQSRNPGKASMEKAADCTGINKRQFTKMYNQETGLPNREFIFKICIGFELTLDEAKELLGSAGYSFKSTDHLDRLVYKCLKDGIYNKYEINETLKIDNYPELYNFE